MGQYWLPVNLDKKEFVNPHMLGTGLKLWEQLANHPGTGAALIVLCAAMPEPRGGGDFDKSNEPYNFKKLCKQKIFNLPEKYEDIANITIGRWAGDRIALVGDYAEDTDFKTLPKDPPISLIFSLCVDGKHEDIQQKIIDNIRLRNNRKITKNDFFTDISHLVVAVIEHELGGEFKGDGWKRFEKKI